MRIVGLVEDSRVVAAVSAASLALMLYFFESHIGLSLKDEGFLWYGSQRVLRGEVPILDFMAYDPGRYYWSAAMMRLLGDDGIVAQRVAIYAIEAIGLFLAFHLVIRSMPKRDWFFLVIAAVTLLIWMYPRHKLFEITTSIVLVAGLAHFLESPTAKRSLLLGAVVGLAALFGRNHGLYGAIASVGAIGWLAFRSRDYGGFFSRCVYWGIGLCLGYLPILVGLMLSPEFASAFLDSIRSNIETGGGHLAVEVPWPWRAPFEVKAAGSATRLFIVGLFFLAIALIPLFLLLRSARRGPVQKGSPLVVASSMLAVPYMHHAYSLATVGHLAQAIFPLLIACLAFLGSQGQMTRRTGAAILCAATIAVMYPLSPIKKCAECVQAVIGRDTLWVDKQTASSVAMLVRLAEKYAPGGQPVMVAPFWPGAYAVLNRKSPVWEIYGLIPRNGQFQRAEIRRLQKADPAFILVNHAGIMGRRNLSFPRSHRQMYRYIRKHYQRAPDLDGSRFQSYRLYVRQGAPQ